MTVVEKLLGVLFPERCTGCRSRGMLLCWDCSKGLLPPESQGTPWIMSAFSYRDPKVSKLIRRLKYSRARRAASALAPGMAAVLMEFMSEEALFIGEVPLVLVPVPLMSTRERVRGYNQAELLAREVSKRLPAGKSVVDTNLLEKRFDTIPQAKIGNRSRRLRNLGKCFRAKQGGGCRGQTIIIVDDVTTTGATLAACKSALKEAGFKKIFALTAAH